MTRCVFWDMSRSRGMMMMVAGFVHGGHHGGQQFARITNHMAEAEPHMLGHLLLDLLCQQQILFTDQRLTDINGNPCFSLFFCPPLMSCQLLAVKFSNSPLNASASLSRRFQHSVFLQSHAPPHRYIVSWSTRKHILAATG